MELINKSQLKVAYIPRYQVQPRWLPVLMSLRYRAGNLDAYLEELVSGLHYGLGASRVILGQYSESGTYKFVVSPELQPGDLKTPDRWIALAKDIVAQTAPELGVYNLQHSIAVAYCGVTLETSQRDHGGILLAFRPEIEPFQTASQQVLTLMANQAAMAMDLEKRCHIFLPVTSYPIRTPHQDDLTSINQQLQQKLDQYRTELQRVSGQLQIKNITQFSLEQRFRKIFSGCHDAIIIIDPAQDRILEANSQTSQLLSYSRRELLTFIKLSQIHFGEMPQLKKFSQTVIKKRRGWTNELTWLTKTKEKLPTEISAVPIEFDGHACILAMVRDISKQKRLEYECERAERKAQNAISQMAEMEDLASIIVHKIRNPLTIVLVGLSSFKGLHLDERFQARLNMALAEAERLNRLLNEILFFSKSRSLDCKPLDFSKWSEDLLHSMESHPSVVDRVIKFTANPIAAIVSADSEKLKQVFMHLIINACEAVRPGEIITWEITRPSKADQLIVRINNGGKTISPAILDKITTLFFTTKPSGNGLGLAIVKRIIEAHQGQLSITSNPEDGTTVMITLPVLN